MPRNIRAEAETCYFSSGPVSQEWWDIGASEWTRGPEPGDTVNFNNKDIYVDVNIDLRQLSVTGQPNALYVSSGRVVHSDSLYINYNYGIVHLHGGTVNNNYGTLYAYDLGCIINNNHGPVYLLSRQGARVGGSGRVIPRVPLMVWT